MRPTGTKPFAPHLALVSKGSHDMRCCPSCGASRATTDPSCLTCHTDRPPLDWARIVEKASVPLEDEDQWVIEASLRPTGPVLRHRVRQNLQGERDPLGVLFLVNDSALFTAFEARARALTEVRHPTIQPPIRVGRHRGRPYRLDRIISAPRLTTLLGTQTPSQVLQLVCQIAEGLCVLHQHGIVHGSVSPGRVAVLNEPDGPQAVLAETPALAAGPWFTQAAPEVLLGRVADPRTDVFGLGLVFWALATGRAPRNESSALWADERPGPALAVGEELDLSDADRALLRTMLDRDPKVRPHDLSTVLTHLRGKTESTSPARTPPRPRPRPRPPALVDVPQGGGRRLIGMVAVALLSLGGLGMLLSTWSGGSEATDNRAAKAVNHVAATATVHGEALNTSDAGRRSRSTASDSKRTNSKRTDSKRTDSTPARAAPPPETAPDPEPSAVSASALSGTWRGIVNGSPATVQIFAKPDRSLSGLAILRVGARTGQHPIEGRYYINDNGSISVLLIMQGTSDAWAGRVVDELFSGTVHVNGDERGEFSLKR